MNRLERVALGLIRPINPYGAVILGAMTLLWGMWLVTPAWDVFTQAHVYVKVDQFAPEWAWGTWSCAAGILVVYAVIRGKYKTLVFSLGFTLWHWWTIAGMLWWGDWQNTAGLVYTFVAIYSTYVWLNMKLNKEELHDFGNF